MAKQNLLKLFQTLLQKGLRPAYDIHNAGGYNNGYDESDAVAVDGYFCTIEGGQGWAFNYTEVTLGHPKHGRLVIREGWQENGNYCNYTVPNRVGHKILCMLHADVFDSVKKYWDAEEDEYTSINYCVPKWEV